jgi:hypothetical protein
MQNFDHNNGFREKRYFFRRKLSKIAQNFDHNIDPGLNTHCIWFFKIQNAINFLGWRRGLVSSTPPTPEETGAMNREIESCQGIMWYIYLKTEWTSKVSVLAMKFTDPFQGFPKNTKFRIFFMKKTIWQPWSKRLPPKTATSLNFPSA